MADEQTKNIREKYVTGKGELTGFIAILKPSEKYDNYTASILLSKEEGEALTQKIKDLQKEQFIICGKKGKLAPLPIEPYMTTNEETGEQIPDEQGRYLLKTGNKAHTSKGEPKPKPKFFNAKGQVITGSISVGEGTIARLSLTLSGYKAPMGIGITAKLKGGQIIKLVEYKGNGCSMDDFEVEEDGFDGIGEAFTDNAPVTDDTEGEEEEF